MPRVSAYPMVSVPDALAAILERVSPLGTETVDLRDARGRVLAEDVVADQDLPGLPRSSVDGYAVIASDPSAEREVLEEVTAGRLAHAQVRPGTAVRIMTGGTLPEGADAVVMVEDVEETPPGRAVLLDDQAVEGRREARREAAGDHDAVAPALDARLEHGPPPSRRGEAGPARACLTSSYRKKPICMAWNGSRP